MEKVSLDQAALLSGETKLAAENTKDVLEEYLSVEQAAALAQTDYGAAVLEFTANCNEQGQPRAVVFSQQRRGTVSSDPRAGWARDMFGYAFFISNP